MGFLSVLFFNAIDISFIRAALFTRPCIAGTGWKVVHDLDVLN